jgi:hypothetical protein
MPALKNYLKYMEKLEHYAETLGLRIISREESSEGAYNHNNSTIVIDPDLSESKEIAVLLHELGHAMDYHLTNKKLSPKIWSAYHYVLGDTPPSQDKLETVMAAEVRAWENGAVIAKRLKIPLGKWYASERKSALLNYRKSTNG